MIDFTNKFNTKLSPENESIFNNWVAYQSKNRGRDLTKDLIDYDLRGYWLNGGWSDAGKGHMPDTYKKPNHPTFSNQSIYNDGKNYIGGEWVGDDFKPGATNMSLYGIDNLK